MWRIGRILQGNPHDVLLSRAAIWMSGQGGAGLPELVA
jgi:hypothetical protein